MRLTRLGKALLVAAALLVLWFAVGREVTALFLQRGKMSSPLDVMLVIAVMLVALSMALSDHPPPQSSGS